MPGKVVDHSEACAMSAVIVGSSERTRRIRTSSVGDAAPGAADWALIPSERDSTSVASVTKQSAFRMSTSSRRSAPAERVGK